MLIEGMLIEGFDCSHLVKLSLTVWGYGSSDKYRTGYNSLSELSYVLRITARDAQASQFTLRVGREHKNFSPISSHTQTH